MIGVVATLKVQPDKTAEFEAVFLDLAAKVKGNEPGCLLYQLTRSKTEAGTYKVLEEIPKALLGKPVQIWLENDSLRIEALA